MSRFHAFRHLQCCSCLNVYIEYVQSWIVNRIKDSSSGCRNREMKLATLLNLNMSSFLFCWISSNSMAIASAMFQQSRINCTVCDIQNQGSRNQWWLHEHYVIEFPKLNMLYMMINFMWDGFYVRHKTVGYSF